MKNLKQYIPILVFVVTLVLSGVTILTSNELEKRKYVPPAFTEARGCTPQDISDGSCPADYVQSINNGSWKPVYDSSGNVTMYTSPAESPDPSNRPQHNESAPPPAAACVPGATTCGACSVSCGGGTQSCSNGCNTTTQSCNTQPCSTPTPTSTPTNTPTPTSTSTPTPTPTPTATPTSTITPTPTITTSSTPTPTGITFSHNVCSNRSCVSQLCSPANQPCNSTCSGEVDCNSRLTCVNLKCVRVTGSGSDDCQSDVSCQPQAVAPKVPTSGTSTPTIVSIIGGAALLVGGILLAL